MLQPKRRKYRKEHCGRMKGKAYRGSDIQFGEFGLKALEQAGHKLPRQAEVVERSVVGL